MPDFRRKPNRLPQPFYTGRNWYFVTLCTRDREPRLADPALVTSLLDCLLVKCRAFAMDVYAYCFMPDHLHLEIAALGENSNLAKMTKQFKGAGGALARGVGVRRLWEKGYYDHILRPDDSADAVAWYIFANPVRKGLVADPRDWPHSGSWMFDWKRAVAPVATYVPPWK